MCKYLWQADVDGKYPGVVLLGHMIGLSSSHCYMVWHLPFQADTLNSPKGKRKWFQGGQWQFLSGFSIVSPKEHRFKGE